MEGMNNANDAIRETQDLDEKARRILMDPTTTDHDIFFRRLSESEKPEHNRFSNFAARLLFKNGYKMTNAESYLGIYLGTMNTAKSVQDLLGEKTTGLSATAEQPPRPQLADRDAQAAQDRAWNVVHLIQTLPKPPDSHADATELYASLQRQAELTATELRMREICHANEASLLRGTSLEGTPFVGNESLWPLYRAKLLESTNSNLDPEMKAILFRYCKDLILNHGYKFSDVW